MLKEKIQDISETVQKVRHLRWKRRNAKQNSGCMKVPESLVVNNFGGAHCVEPRFVRCHCYDENKYCANVHCSNYIWNMAYIDLNKQLCDAKKARNAAIMRLLWLPVKIAQYKEYKRLSKEEEAKAGRVYPYYGLEKGADFIQCRDEWDEVRGKLNAARAELFGRAVGGK
ncbi:MAG: hypothetical protein J6T57_03865 [Alphaproteobacteria bacterium]|nr:hypothetical protein [Alphaproteobacteria bacterium]